MIRAHMATYPARVAFLERSLATLADQVDQVFLCLNEFTEIPSFLKSYKNVTPVIPDEDFKDVGKFLFAPDPDDLVVMADDDLLYSPKHVRRLRRIGGEIGLETCVVGVHGTIYRPDVDALVRKRISLHFEDPLVQSRRVHQLGTGTVLALGRNVAPLDYMQGSQKFVDVRYARWLHESGITSWAIERPKGFLREIVPERKHHETIFKTFTRRTPENVLDEIRSFLEELP
jgi:hypothetical protein